MKHKNFTTRAELLRAAADSIEMQENAGALPECKIKGIIWYIVDTYLDEKPNIYEFPLAVVEGKQVYEGDELYRNGELIVADEDYFFIDDDIAWSWNPPKTVMVELSVEVVENIASGCFELTRVREACRKALEEMKCQK